MQLKPIFPPKTSGEGEDQETLTRLRVLQQRVWDVHVDVTLQDYIVRLVGATREHHDLALGASPRASLALYKTSQALAALRGRDFVIPDDIKVLVPVTIPHRLIMKPESQLRGKTVSMIIEDILEKIPLELESDG